MSSEMQVQCCWLTRVGLDSPGVLGPPGPEEEDSCAVESAGWPLRGRLPAILTFESRLDVRGTVSERLLELEGCTVRTANWFDEN